MTARRHISLAAIAVLVTAVSPVAWAEPLSSDWVNGFQNRARLVAGSVAKGGASKTYAAIEIEMPHEWKTYWRSIGEAGGIPPEFDWSGSENLASAVVRYPAPRRLSDKAGDVVGYKDRAVFPIELTAKDPSLPVKLLGKINYGVCKDLCVPAEVALNLEIPASVDATDVVTDAVEAVPGAARDGVDPRLKSWRVDQTSEKPTLVLNVSTSSPADADAFVDLADGTFVPLPKRVADSEGAVRFEVDLTDGVDIKDLKGKPLRITLVDGKGQSETTITLE